MHKEVKEIARKLERQGWTIKPGTKHDLACPPDKDKPCVPLPGSPGRGRWKENLVAQLRRSGADL
jgi:hypothetical protein